MTGTVAGASDTVTGAEVGAGFSEDVSHREAAMKQMTRANDAMTLTGFGCRFIDQFFLVVVGVSKLGQLMTLVTMHPVPGGTERLLMSGYAVGRNPT